MGAVSSDPTCILFLFQIDLNRYLSKLDGDGEIVWGRAYFSNIQSMFIYLP